MKQYQCPACSGMINMDNINVATDVALCRSCGQTTAFSVLSGISELSTVKLDTPPRGVRITEDLRGIKTIQYKRLSPVLLFLIPFTCIWAGGSMGGIYGSQIAKGEFELTQSLFGIPFLIGSIVLVSVNLFMLFGKWVIQIRPGEGMVFVGIGKLGWVRTFSLTSQSVISLTLSSIRQNDRPCKVIQIQTGDQQIKFGSSMPDDVKQYIAAVVTREKRGI